jgi:hypothetical protein
VKVVETGSPWRISVEQNAGKADKLSRHLSQNHKKTMGVQG